MPLHAGGSASASDAIHREVLLLRKAGKPVVVSMGNAAASGERPGLARAVVAALVWIEHLPNSPEHLLTRWLL